MFTIQVKWHPRSFLIKFSHGILDKNLEYQEMKRNKNSVHSSTVYHCVVVHDPRFHLKLLLFVKKILIFIQFNKYNIKNNNLISNYIKNTLHHLKKMNKEIQFFK